MLLSEHTYVPALRWRQAEYQALVRLGEAVKDQIVPLITIPDVEFDFELRRSKRTIHEHVEPFVSRYQSKWGRRSAWVALDEAIAKGRMSDGSHVFDYIFKGIAGENVGVVPALPLAVDSETIAAAAEAIGRDGQGSGIIVRIEDLMATGAQTRVIALAKALRIRPMEVDLIVDLEGPNFRPYEVFAKALVDALGRLGDSRMYRNFVLVSTAIPEAFTDIRRGTDEIPRHDWLFFQRLLMYLPKGTRRPVYGDYTIVHPRFEAKDMRKLRPAGKIVYTTRRTWGTRKGGAFIDDREQMHGHCQAILCDAQFEFRGKAFSSGDTYISECAAKRKGPSTPGRWKEVGINHHITLVAEELANLHDASLHV